MDGPGFDRLTRRLSSATSRRSVLKGLLAGAAVSLTSIGASKTALAKGEKALVCHATGSASNPWELIEVSVNAIPDHEAHGDTINPDFGSDVNNCGGCGIVCEQPASACQAAICSEEAGGCTIGNANEGGDCTTDSGLPGSCASGLCKPSTCSNTVLAGSADGTAQVCVDDTITVYHNGALIYRSASTANCSGPISLGTVMNGDLIRVTANNGSESDFACGHESLKPIYLVCVDGSGSQTLDRVGVPDDGNDHPCEEVYYDRTFTAAL